MEVGAGELRGIDGKERAKVYERRAEWCMGLFSGGH